MRRVNAELWAGIAMLIVTLGVSTPALLGQVPLRIPHAMWVGVFIVMIAAVIASLMISSERLARWVFCIAPAGAWVALLTAEGSGLFDIVIVVLAAVSVYHLPWQATAVLIVCNTVVLAVSAWLQGSAAGTVVVVAGLYFLLQAGAALSSMTLLREQQMRRELAAAHIEMQATTALLASQSRAAERLRISRDVHDSIGHHLTVLSIELEAAKHSAEPEVHDHVARASDVAREVLRDLRETVDNLRDESDSLEGALRPMLESLPDVAVDLDIDPEVQLDAIAHVAVVRAVQEAATNTLRHADATTLQVELISDAEGVVLSVCDNGRGSKDVVAGNGIRGLRERFEALGGTVDLDGSNGFSVTARIPA